MASQDTALHNIVVANATTACLRRIGREFAELVRNFEAGLLQSLEDVAIHSRTRNVRREACRLAVAELSARYARKHIRRALDEAEGYCRHVEDQLQRQLLDPPYRRGIPSEEHLGSLFNGHFRLFSSDLFDLLGQPTHFRLGTLRFHHGTSDFQDYAAAHSVQSPRVTVELALNQSFFIADSYETMPYHAFNMPSTPSLQNRALLSRKPQDRGAFPDFDSWLLFTFLGNGVLRLEIPIEMCADIYGGRLRGRVDQEVVFWATFVADEEE